MKRNRKNMVCAMLLIMAAVLLIAFAAAEAGPREPELSEVESDTDCFPLCIKWDGKDYYWTEEKVYEDLLRPETAGTISAVVHGALTENGQTNIPGLEGAEIRRTAYGDAIAVFVEGEWMWLERRGEGAPAPEDVFYIPKNSWRMFKPDKDALKYKGVTLAAEQEVVEAEAFFQEGHVALLLKNDSENEISYCRSAIYVLKEIDGEWHYWLGERGPEDTAEDSYVVPPSGEQRFLAPMERVFPKAVREAGTYRLGMYVDCADQTGSDAGRAFVFAELTVK